MTEGQSGIPAHVQEFLRDSVASYEQLEILLLLRRASEPASTGDMLAEKLGLPDSAVDEALEHLRHRNLIEQGGDATSRVYRYSPASPELAALVDEFAHAYDTNRLEIISLMSKNAIERVRTHAQRMFAEAFIWGSKKK